MYPLNWILSIHLNKRSMISMGNVGKPPIIKSPEHLEKSIDDYFEWCAAGKQYSWVDKRGEYHEATLSIPPSTESLSLHLGFTNRSSLLQYETRNEGHEVYVSIIKRARARIASEKLAMAERGLLNERVVMFDLAVNHGYIQQVEINVNHHHELSDADKQLLSGIAGNLPQLMMQQTQAVHDSTSIIEVDSEASNSDDIDGEQSELD